MEEKKITYKLSDTGHWLARCDHSTNVIELNRREFFRLSPMLQEYIWIHEHVHLLHDVYDEAECNIITDEIFVSRAKNEQERLERINFVVRSNDSSLTKSNFWTVLLGSILSLGTTFVTSTIRNNNVGYYSLGVDDRKRFIDSLLSESFQASLLTDSQSAKDIFWQNLSPTIARRKEQTYAGWRASNEFIDEYIEKYERHYGFGFDQILPANPMAHPQYQKMMKTFSIIAIALAIVVLALVLLKTKK